AGSLLSPDLRDNYIKEAQRAQEEARTQYLGKRTEVSLLTLSEARSKKLTLDWTSNGRPPVPSFTGIHRISDQPLSQLVPFIDWTPFFHAWEIKGLYPRVLDDPKARELFADGQKLLARIVSEKLLKASAVYGFFPANSVGDDIEVYDDESRTETRAVLHTLRQQTRKGGNEPNLALADFVAPKETRVGD